VNPTQLVIFLLQNTCNTFPLDADIFMPTAFAAALSLYQTTQRRSS